MNIYEMCCRRKLRFATRKGKLTVEDLLDLSLQSLDRVGRTIMEEIKAQGESLLDTNSSKGIADEEVKLQVVKTIIEEKQQKMAVPIKENNFPEEEVL